MFTHEFVTHSSALSSAAKLPSTETFSPAHSHQFASLRDTPNTRKPVTTFPALAVITSRRVVHCVHFIIMSTHNSENKFSSHKFGHIMVLTRPMQQHSASQRSHVHAIKLLSLQKIPQRKFFPPTLRRQHSHHFVTLATLDSESEKFRTHRLMIP